MNLAAFRRLLHEDIFELFRKRKAVPALDDPSSFGNIAIAKGYITPEILQGTVLVQKERLKIGEILMTMGHLTAHQCDEILVEQDKMRAKTKIDQTAAEMRHHRRIMRRTTEELAKLSKTGDFLTPDNRKRGK